MTEQSAFRVTLRMEIRPGMGPEFEQAWRDGASVITDQPANLGQWLSRSAEEQDVYYIVSDWTDEPGFRTYEESEEHLVHRQKLHPYRAKGSMTTMHLLHGLTGTGARG
ncbi:antibiotic biosynthesis monooxygenase [Micromonospora yasonensis]|uniref:antibiotic biosynthesis monooxygenase family protein n=1 Tax=Micromonospora yasonensis TaxID=1128667 RepID=UPI00223082B0|nr:antibiotic biosynthesis monooxygenase family protein [Micromonospora yasonensis]MCW3840386.1 antibiotic biosynthesis monooxygenase [Micromonospora yasonensis]